MLDQNEDFDLMKSLVRLHRFKNPREKSRGISKNVLNTRNDVPT